MFHFDEHFWILVAFVLFCISVFKFAKKLISNGIKTYVEKIVSDIDFAKKAKEESELELIASQKRNVETEKRCREIIDYGKEQANKIENDARQKVEAFLKHKNDVLEVKISSLEREALKQIQERVINEAVTVVSVLLKNKTDKEKIDTEVQFAITELTKKKL